MIEFKTNARRKIAYRSFEFDKSINLYDVILM